jgi:hypothetical protein
MSDELPVHLRQPMPIGICPDPNCSGTQFVTARTPDGHRAELDGESWWRCTTCGRVWPRSEIR